MKNLAYYASLTILITALNSCSEKSIGDWDDNIKLSTKTADFNAAGDSVIIKTKGSWWWVTGIKVDDTYYNDFTGINLEADNYTIKQNCYQIERRDKNTLFIKVDANPLNVKRIISVGLEAGDYFDGVTITQKPK